MGRTKYSFYIDDDIKATYEARAEIQGTTTSDVIRQVLADAAHAPCTGFDKIAVDVG
jgi:hypothetical protein